MTESQQSKDTAPVEEGNTAEHDSGVSAPVSESGSGDQVEQKSSGGGGFLAFLALLVAAGVGVGGYIFWQESDVAMHGVDKRLVSLEKSAGASSKQDAQFNRLESSLSQLRSGLRGQIDQRLQPVEAAISELKRVVAAAGATRNGGDLSALQGRVDALQASIQELTGSHQSIVSRSDLDAEKAVLTARLDENATVLKDFSDQLGTFQTQLAKGTDVALLRDAAHLLRVANDSLHFDRDVRAAKMALEEAGNRLKLSKADGVADTLALIGQDLDRLGATQVPDLAALSVDLIDLQHQLEGLPLPRPGHKVAPGVDKLESHGVMSSVKGFFSDMWSKVKGLVTIRRSNAGDAPLRSPEQQLYLVENSRLKLETARIALMRGDDANFHASLGAVRNWLQRYSPGEAASLLSILDRLDQANINPEFPDISDSLSSLMRLLDSQGVAFGERERGVGSRALS